MAALVFLAIPSGDRREVAWAFWGLVFAGALCALGAAVIPKLLVACFQVLLAGASNYYQLSKLVEAGAQTQVYDRLTFIVAGVAVMATGFKTLSKHLVTYPGRSNVAGSNLAPRSYGERQ